MISVSLRQVSAIPTVVAMARGAARAQATLGALRGGLVSALVVDDSLARTLLAD